MGEDDVGAALDALVDAIHDFGGAYVGDFTLEGWPAPIKGGHAGWLCAVEIDAKGGEFDVLGHTALEALTLAREKVEALRSARERG